MKETEKLSSQSKQLIAAIAGGLLIGYLGYRVGFTSGVTSVKCQMLDSILRLP